MPDLRYLPLYEFTRGHIVESIHYGAIAVVDAGGNLVAHYGDPHTITYLRSTAKPFQALPFVEQGGPAHFGFTLEETALICASHSGTDKHFHAAHSIQQKIGVTEEHLQCGVHMPMDAETSRALRGRGEAPTPNRHNCSGKHSGMLAYAQLNGWPVETYLEHDHPVQKNILRTFSEITDVPKEKIEVGTDGCSAPNFAVPLFNAALAYARLSGPSSLPKSRKAACRTITHAMSGAPDMIGGPGTFDTTLMEIAKGRLVAKGGAEGYQGIGILPGALGPDSPALGIAYKISDGTVRSRGAVGLEILRQLGALTEGDLDALSGSGPRLEVKNWRKLIVGEGRPSFKLQF